MMQKFLVLLVQLTAYVAYGQLNLNYRQDGEYVIGAILPLSSKAQDGKCSDINPKGLFSLYSSWIFFLLFLFRPESQSF